MIQTKKESGRRTSELGCISSLGVSLWLASCGGPLQKNVTREASMKHQEDGAGTHSLRVCRYQKEGEPAVALYGEDGIVDLEALYSVYSAPTQDCLAPPENWGDSLAFLPHGTHAGLAAELASFYPTLEVEQLARLRGDEASVQILPPLSPPSKFFLLAGNYAAHIEEGGGTAAQPGKTFPYVFWKPPTTTMRGSGQPVILPAISPESIDWEIELAVVIRKRCKKVSASQALDVVAGYAIVNDISNRRFRPNPDRKERPRDSFFDWLHGKWFDGFAPIGPCITSARSIPDPQVLPLQLKVNGKIRQDSNTAKMIFPVADIIAFISSYVTLEPGDVISTGTPAGVGHPKRVFLEAGDLLETEIEGIGILRNPVVSEPPS